MKGPSAFAASVLAAVVILGGCAKPQLVATPNLYHDRSLEPFAEVPPHFRTNTVDLLYVTDREREGETHETVSYGYERSPVVTLGSCVVEIGRDVAWDDLVEASRSAKREISLPLAVRSMTELHRFPETPAPLTTQGGVVRVTDEHLAANERATATLHDEVRRRLALTPRKEAFVFVHGYNNTLELAAFRMTSLWHFLGREGVPIVYSWPAGHPGLIRGYTHDRESGEFTIYHLKQFLRALAACPGLETISLVSHSRGTDVMANAVREIVLEERAAGRDPGAELKIRAVILAAPDIAIDVLAQRYLAENLYGGFKSVTYYVMKKDKAIGSAEWLFADKRRIGQARPDQFSDRQRQRWEQLQEITIVDSRVRTDFLGHGYFLSSPATFSDVLLVLRYDRPPGAEHGRPLTKIAQNYYILDDDFPQKAAPKPTPRKQSSRPYGR